MSPTALLYFFPSFGFKLLVLKSIINEAFICVFYIFLGFSVVIFLLCVGVPGQDGVSACYIFVKQKNQRQSNRIKT